MDRDRRSRSLVLVLAQVLCISIPVARSAEEKKHANGGDASAPEAVADSGESQKRNETYERIAGAVALPKEKVQENLKALAGAPGSEAFNNALDELGKLEARQLEALDDALENETAAGVSGETKELIKKIKAFKKSDDLNLRDKLEKGSDQEKKLARKELDRRKNTPEGFLRDWGIRSTDEATGKSKAKVTAEAVDGKAGKSVAMDLANRIKSKEGLAAYLKEVDAAIAAADPADRPFFQKLKKAAEISRAMRGADGKLQAAGATFPSNEAGWREAYEATRGNANKSFDRLFDENGVKKFDRVVELTNIWKEFGPVQMGDKKQKVKYNNVAENPDAYEKALDDFVAGGGRFRDESQRTAYQAFKANRAAEKELNAIPNSILAGRVGAFIAQKEKGAVTAADERTANMYLETLVQKGGSSKALYLKPQGRELDVKFPGASLVNGPIAVRISGGGNRREALQETLEAAGPAIVSGTLSTADEFRKTLRAGSSLGTYIDQESRTYTGNTVLVKDEKGSLDYKPTGTFNNDTIASVTADNYYPANRLRETLAQPKVQHATATVLSLFSGDPAKIAANAWATLNAPALKPLTTEEVFNAQVEARKRMKYGK